MSELDDLNAKLDTASLVREEVVTDRKVGTIRVLTPITEEGALDLTRPVQYLGETQIMTQMGPLPISFQIDAKNLKEAIAAYPEATKKGIQDTLNKIEQMRRDAASRIVKPGDEGFASAASKIQMP